MRSSREALKVLLLVSALGLSWAACSHAGPAPEARVPSRGPETCSTEVRRAEVLLRVVDTQGRPIPGASVALNPPMLMAHGPAPSESQDGLLTDAAGELRLTPRVDSDIPPFIIINAEGYRDATWSLDLLPGEQRRVDVRLTPSVAISGRVVDVRGQPLPGAEVMGHGVTFYWGEMRTTADAEGRFSLSGLPPGPVALRVSLGGQAPNDMEVVAPRSDVELVWKTSTLSVEVRDARGQPLPGVLLGVQDASALGLPMWMGAPRTDARGKAELGPLPPGPHRVQALWARPGFQWVTSQEVVLAPNQGHSVVLSFEGSRVRPPLTGRVTDAEGRPLRDVEILATPVTSPDPGSLRELLLSETPDEEQSRARSDAQGRFTLEGLREGPVRIRAMEGSESFEESPPVEVPPGHDTVALLLPRRSTLQGEVVDPEGRPVTNLRFRVNDEHVDSPTGRFEGIIVPSGRVTLAVIAEGFAVERRTVQVPARKAFRLTEPIVLQPGREVSGRVVKDDGCTPIAGAVVMLDREAPPRDSRMDPLTTRTDAEGRFTLSRLEREPLVLRVDKRPPARSGPPGQIPMVRVPVAADEDSVTVRFGPEASVTGVVTDGEGRPVAGADLGSDCTSFYQPVDATGRFVLHGLEGGRECVLHVDVSRAERAAEHSPPPLVFTPRRVVLPKRGTLRVDLTAREGPASLRVRLPRKDVSAFLLEGAVPRPSTWEKTRHLLMGALTPDPRSRLSRSPDAPHDARMEAVFSQLSPGHYTLLVTRDGSEGSDVAVVHLPVTLDGPGAKQVEVDFSTARTLAAE
ncbi:carboxypeptidase regulatory-like domain-containing protein [Pyxidicoccus fallax]|uniref:Carboxypeptidase regulatory-like domain-containing protein n=1 Tax=Pyxidicoccus fallax TaxID=394095 RepID=A0A848LNK2_9BACT|nr:carboxypeptidase-like regulatory domain-containing protein [Pyxidicoccus fallax]NMO19259.1 carboxypeptidase regulatory-like domain-containing protein [Pyxidicoccus fallax]NPC79830.1 carboxypeptidase regulatory-like domain-containing protein [Pyxidicoccus fallax]